MGRRRLRTLSLRGGAPRLAGVAAEPRVTNQPVVAAIIDIAGVLVFVLIGIASHNEGLLREATRTLSAPIHRRPGRSLKVLLPHLAQPSTGNLNENRPLGSAVSIINRNVPPRRGGGVADQFRHHRDTTLLPCLGSQLHLLARRPPPQRPLTATLRGEVGLRRSRTRIEITMRIHKHRARLLGRRPRRPRKDTFSADAQLDFTDGFGGSTSARANRRTTCSTYPKPNHEPASFTVLNFAVEDVEAAVRRSNARGVKTKYADDEPDMPMMPGIMKDEDGKPAFGLVKRSSRQCPRPVDSHSFGGCDASSSAARCSPECRAMEPRKANPWNWKRPRRGRIIAGVCAAIARRFG